MICPYCSQWNTERNRRCCFCDNPPDSSEDVTVNAKPKYAMRAATIQQALPSSYDLPRAAKPRPQLKISLTPDQAIGAGVGLLVIIILVLSRC